MREHVFAQPDARQQLEAIVHPLVAWRSSAKRPQPARCMVFDVPLLVESPRWRQQLDRVLVVDCSTETQIQRVRSATAGTGPTIEAVIWQPGPSAQRLAAADMVIFNDGDDIGRCTRPGADGPTLRAMMKDLHDRCIPSPSAAVILYEYPFNERIRTYLRLEQLFRRLAELIPRNHALDHHFAIQTIFEIMDVASRADMKSDVLKDIDRHKQQLNSYRGNPAISEKVLDEVIAQLDDDFTRSQRPAGKTGQSLTENDWLMSIRSRIGIPGGTCEFDLPAYYPGNTGMPTNARPICRAGRRHWRLWPSPSCCC
jgi:hypothetical protein